MEMVVACCYSHRPNLRPSRRIRLRRRRRLLLRMPIMLLFWVVMMVLLIPSMPTLLTIHALSSSSSFSGSHKSRSVADTVSKTAGLTALRQVENLGHRLTGDVNNNNSNNNKLQSEQYFGKSPRNTISSVFEMADDYQGGDREKDNDDDEFARESIFKKNKRQLEDQRQQQQSNDNDKNNKNASSLNKKKKSKKNVLDRKEKQVWAALANLETDMQLLDRLAGQKPQLSAIEFTLLSSAVLSSVASPLLLNGRLAEFISPAAAAFTAAMGIAAEYTGKVAVADGKEVAAVSIQCAAEAEGFLANAERVKAITPLCVGVGATAATLALLVPVLLDSLGVGSNLQLVTEIYLFCPLVAVLAAAVAGLAVQEVRTFCNLAIGVGNRRFARSGLVGRTWLSSTEIIDRKSKGVGNKWKTFCFSVLPAPLLGAFCPGALPTKTIVVAALAAAESAFYLAQSEYILARAMDAVALKSRSAAVCDTYANQGARSASILPFTSALSGLCAAATAAIVELPFVEALASSGTVSGTFLEICTVSAFPAFSALFAAAASVSKARCEVDAEAAMQAASTIALPYNSEEEDPILRPLVGVRELIRLTIKNSIREPLRRFLRKMSLRRRWRWADLRKFNFRRKSARQSKSKDNKAAASTA